MSDSAKNFQFRTVDGCEIAYSVRPSTANREAGRIVFIHSLGFDQSMWDGVVSRLAAAQVPGEGSLGSKIDALTYDCRGHGKSARGGHVYTSRGSEVYTTDQFADDLAQLLDEVKWPRAVVVGCSMGGCVAQAFAARYPPRVNALALIDTTAFYGREAPAQWRERAAAARAKGLSGMVDFQLSRWFSERFRAENPELMRHAAQVLTSNDVEGYAAACVMLGGIDFRASLKSISVPTAVIFGEDDYATPLAMSRELHEAIPASTLTILPGARHITPVECPDKIADELANLLLRARKFGESAAAQP